MGDTSGEQFLFSLVMHSVCTQVLSFTGLDLRTESDCIDAFKKETSPSKKKKKRKKKQKKLRSEVASHPVSELDTTPPPHTNTNCNNQKQPSVAASALEPCSETEEVDLVSYLQ